MKHPLGWSVLGLSLTWLLTATIGYGQASAQNSTPAARPHPPAVVSPEVTADRTVIFRILAPEAKTVVLDAWDMTSHGQKIPELTRNDEGVWEATTAPLAPGAYRYLFKVDGVSTVDPNNPATSESNEMVWSLVVVPGGDFVDDRDNVPHGSVSTVYYHSTSLGRQRRMHIYTPPGYETSKKKYPVFYLLHGSSDSDASWSTEGRANFILDNLIADGKAVPMIVVMPAGHTSRRGYVRPSPDGKPERNEFVEDFVNDIMPYVDKNYRVRTDRAHTAIAGLSMGGGQSIDIFLSHMDRFAYVGVWSAGVFAGSRRTPAGATPFPAVVSPEWVEQHASSLDNAKLKPGLKLLWFGTGADDGLLPTTKATVAMFKEHGFNPELVVSEGAHTWSNWRDYLNGFAPRLFR